MAIAMFFYSEYHQALPCWHPARTRVSSSMGGRQLDSTTGIVLSYRIKTSQPG